jgi:hypothetical protein
MEIKEEFIGIEEISKYLTPYLRGIKPIPPDDKLLFKFNEKLQAIDELFYAYLLLLKQCFPNIEIIILLPENETTNKAYWIAQTHITQINLHIKYCKIKINNAPPNYYQNISKDFFPHILVEQNSTAFNPLEKDFREVSDTKFPLAIECAQRVFVTLSNLKNKKLLHILDQYDFYKRSPIEYYFLHLFIVRYIVESKTKKKILESNDTLFEILKKVDNIYKGLKELAKNIIEHSGRENKSGFGVISARVFSKEKTEKLKNFGTGFSGWFDIHKNEEKEFLDINVIDAGAIGVTQHYLNSTQNDFIRYNEKFKHAKSENEKSVYEGLKNAAQNDITILQEYSIPHLFDFKNVKLNHQKYRANARIGLLMFSNLLSKREGGIVKAVTKSQNNESVDYEAYCFYVDKEKKFKSESLNSTDNAFVPFGTNYNFIIPITAKRIIKTNLLYKIEEQGSSTSLLNELFEREIHEYKTILLNENVEKSNLRAVTVKCSNEIIDFYKNISDKSKNNKRKIVLINADHYKQFSESDWVRFLIGTQFSTNVEEIERVPLIIYNISKELCQNINDVCKFYEDAFETIIPTNEEKNDKNLVFGFWMPDSAILFYFKHGFNYSNKNKLSLWFSSVLAGNTYKEYLSLNKDISQYQRNLFSIIRSESIDVPNALSFENNPLFDSKDYNKLLSFELLIKDDKEDLTLFELSVKNLLDLDIRTLPDKAEEVGVDNESHFFYNFKGFKVSDSHFSLGAKIHISDYYYAKRIFYNSFYANRFAFLISKYLLENDGFGIIEKNKRKEITLIGYSRYSELLISNIKRLLEFRKILNIEINHDVILEDGRALKNPAKIYDNVIIIIPIASTFSTSAKIKKAIDRIRSSYGSNGVKIINDNVINIFCVVDEETFESEDYTKSELYKPFGWEKREKDIVTLMNGQKQKYFIDLKSKWFLIHDCELCFPQSSKMPKDEKCLLETGMNAVSPESIFSFPITDNSEDCDKDINFEQYFKYEPNDHDNKTFIIEKHACRDNKHFKHYIKTDEFFDKKKNRDKIEKWLENNEKIEQIRKITKSHKIVIITPSRTANSGFVNWVNQYVFFETATVLQYSDTDDILQNFIHFNASFFSEDSFIFFIDDVLRTASSLQNINDYIQRISLKDNSTKKKIDGCIVLFNRLGLLDKEGVKNNLSEILLKKGSNNDIIDDNRLIAYATINLPPIHLSNYEFPLVKKEKTFGTLSNLSVTDIMKLHFKEQKDRLKPYDFDKDINYPQGKWDDLFHFFVFKALYSFFYGDFKDGLFEYEKREWIEIFLEKKDSKEKSVLFAKLVEYVKNSKDLKSFIDYTKNTIYTDYSEEVENEITYILATPPFVYYKDIREFAFYLVLEKLKKIVAGIKQIKDFYKYHIRGTVDGQYATPHCKFENFKHFLNLAADLKVNYVFSTEMLESIEIMLNHWKKTEGKIYRKQIEKENTKTGILFPKSILKEIKDSYDIGFRTFYLGVIERLIKEDEAKAIKVIKNIVAIRRSFPDTINPLRNHREFNNQFVELLRDLVIENTFIFKTYIEEFDRYCEENKIKFSFETKYNDFQDRTIYPYYNNRENQAARQAALEKMLWDYKKDDIDEELKEAFFKTIYLKELLKSENSSTSDVVKISKKTETILKYLSEILGMSEGECSNGGAYFTIRFNEKNKPENEISEDDLYTIAKHSVKPDSEDEIDTNLTAEDTLAYQLYKGIKEKNSKKPESVIELFYDEIEQRYQTTVLEEYHYNMPIDVNDEKWFETGNTFGKRYKNLLFLRITDIKENKAYHEVLEKYIDVFIRDKDKLTEDEKKEEEKVLLGKLQKCEACDDKLYNEILDLHTHILKLTKTADIKRLIQYLKIDADNFKFSLKTKQKLFKRLNERNNTTDAKNILFQYNRYNDYISNPIAVIVFYKCRLCKSEHYPCCEKYDSRKCKEHLKRFDPKRLRFIMLLRDDILNFCKRHFDNDSLRAFVETEISNIKEKSYLHGTDEYEDIKQICFDNGGNMIVKQAELTINYLTNKKLLVNYLLDRNNRNEPTLFTVQDFIKKINSNYQDVLNFRFGKYTRLDNYNNISPNVLFRDDQISEKDKNINFYFLNLLIDEIVFELMYNIRKSILHKLNAITEGKPLIISLNVERKKINEQTTIIYFVVANNKCPKHTNADKINRNIQKDIYRRDGLNLINNCLSEFYKDDKGMINFHIEIDKDDNNELENRYFRVFIPIKILKTK